MNQLKRNTMKETARAVITKAARLKKKTNVLIICGIHNQNFAQELVLQSYSVGAHPFLWIFDEKPYHQNPNIASLKSVQTLPTHALALLEESHVVIWLSQYAGFPSTSKTLIAFWDAVYGMIHTKPRLMVNLPSPKSVRALGIRHDDFLDAFTNAVNVDYSRIKRMGTSIFAKLNGKESVHVTDPNGTDLTFSIKNRPIGIEAGALEECYAGGKECEIEVPAGEVYVAPIETSANGILVVDEARDFAAQELQMRFEKGKITRLEAKKGKKALKEYIAKAKGDADRIAELGIGINHGMKPVGWKIYDEKASGTAHIAIGENTRFGGTNKATIHLDFILHKPTIHADDKLVITNGKPANQ